MMGLKPLLLRDSFNPRTEVRGNEQKTIAP